MPTDRHALPESFRALAPALAATVLCATMSATALAGTLPTLPLTFDSSYAAQTGRTLVVNSGGDLQAALNQAALGDTIVLQAGATYVGPYTLPNKSSGTGWIYIQSNAYAQLPRPGGRVSPADAVNMPRLVAPANDHAIVTVNGSHHFRFVGIEFKTTPNTYMTNLVQLGNEDKTTSTLPSHITFDRCYFNADTNVGARRGLLANAAYVAVTDSYFEGFRENGADSQAINAYNTSGPLRFINNYLSGAGENMLIGGSDSAAPTLIPSDIEIRGNSFFKPLNWMNSGWVVKNLLELKDARRVLISNNRFENNWAAAQTGFSLLITPRNDNGTAKWTITEDVTVTDNTFVNIGSGVNILGTDDLHPSQRTARILLRNNFLSVNGLNGAQGWSFMLLAGPRDVTIDHNTVIASKTFLFAENGPGTTKTDQFTLTNNIFVSPTGLIGTGTGPGLDTLTAFFSNWTIAKNAMTSGSASSYPAGNFFPASATEIRFVDAGSGNYALSASSPYKGAGTDGQDLGASSTLTSAPMSGSTNDRGPGAETPKPPQGLKVR